jgi:hypothetical protein
MSIATGHQVMQRPQPTQPDDPNWSIQVAIDITEEVGAIRAGEEGSP